MSIIMRYHVNQRARSAALFRQRRTRDSGARANFGSTPSPPIESFPIKSP